MRLGLSMKLNLAKKKKSKLCGNPSMESIYEKSTKWEKQLILIFNSLPCLLVIFII